MIDLDIRCEKCDRYLNLKGVFTIIAQVKCPNNKCKHLNNVHVVTPQSSDLDIRFKFDQKQIK